jgi:murein DD-endopeptidase MepM/ murein hydrolase activator NlpD
MKNKSVITISPINESAGFQLTKRHITFIKRTLLFLFISVFILAASFDLLYLKNKVQRVEVKEKILIEQADSLNSTIESLNSEKNALQQDLIQRDSLISNVSLRLEKIEDYLDVNKNTEKQRNPLTDTDDDFMQRLDNAAISSAIRSRLFNLIPNGVPVINARQSSRYGYRTHPITKKKRMHRGLDFAVKRGTPVYATADGVVEVTRKSKSGSGNFLRIQHSFGFSSSFSHLKAFKVTTGEFVEKGQLIAFSGDTGLSSGPHLHYEVRFVGRSLNPNNFVQWNNQNFDEIFAKEKKVNWAFLVKKVEQQISMQLQLLSGLDAELIANSNRQVNSEADTEISPKTQ